MQVTRCKFNFFSTGCLLEGKKEDESVNELIRVYKFFAFKNNARPEQAENKTSVVGAGNAGLQGKERTVGKKFFHRHRATK